jgi:hypothetical protein
MVEDGWSMKQENALFVPVGRQKRRKYLLQQWKGENKKGVHC